MAKILHKSFWCSEVPADALGSPQDHFRSTLKQCMNELEFLIHAYFHDNKENPDGLPLQHLQIPLTLKAMLTVLSGEFPSSFESSELISYGEWISDPENVVTAMLAAVLHMVKDDLLDELENQNEKNNITKKDLKYESF